MNKILKTGFAIIFLAVVITIVIILLNKMVPYSLYLFLVGFIVTFVGTILDKKMNKISKSALGISVFAGTMMIILMILGKTVPDFIMYLFGGGLAVAFLGALLERRKNQLL